MSTADPSPLDIQIGASLAAIRAEAAKVDMTAVAAAFARVRQAFGEVRLPGGSSSSA